nr:ribonuclease H-like domain-containing protein [Tanacetum cinerariifolium]
MDSLSTPVVSAAKLPILNPNEFDLWKMRIEQYFLMTDDSLWEVIINGDSPAPTVVIDGVVRPVTILSADQKLEKRNELKARVSAATSVSAVCAQLPVSSYPNIDSLSHAIIFSFFASQSTSPHLDNEDLKQIDVDDLEEIDLRWQMAMLIMRARRECRSPKDTRRTDASEPQRRHVLVETSTSNALVSECDENDSESLSPSCPSDRLRPSGGYNAVPPPIIGNFMPPKPDLVFHTSPIVVETNHSTFTVQLSPTKPAQDFSHTTRPMAPIIEDWVSDLEDESEPNDPQSVSVFVPTIEHVKPSGHSVQLVKVPILAATSKPTSPKTNCSVRLVSDVVPKIMVTRTRHAYSLNTKSNSTIRRHKTLSQSSKTSNSFPKVTAANAQVGNPQYALKDKGVIDSGYSWHMTGNMSYLFDFQELNGGYVAFVGNPKGGKISGNMSYLSDFQELNGGYVAFVGNPKGGKISGKGKIKTGKLDFEDVYFVNELKFNLFSVSQMCEKKNKVLFTDSECLVLSPDFKQADESQVLLRVPRENNMYNETDTQGKDKKPSQKRQNQTQSGKDQKRQSHSK